MFNVIGKLRIAAEAFCGRVIRISAASRSIIDIVIKSGATMS